MPNKEVQEQFEKGELVLFVDDPRAVDDPHKFSPWMRPLVTTRPESNDVTHSVPLGP